MDVKTITLEYLRQNHFDGLFCEDICACKLNDLFPCSGNGGAIECEPGYFQPGAEAAGCKFLIGPDKPESGQQ